MTKGFGFSKLAAITCGTLLLGGVAMSEAQAATQVQTQTFNISVNTGNQVSSNIGFNLFNPTLGTLTAVSFDLDSLVTAFNDEPFTASLSISGNELDSFSPSTFTNPPVAEDPFNFTNKDGLVGALTLGAYTGPGGFDVAAILTSQAGNCCTGGQWTGDGTYTGLTLTYTYDAAVVPVPAAVWLFGSGLLGLVGMARRKKA